MKKPMHHQAAPHIFVNAKKLREERTPAEIALWEAIREKKLDGLKFRQQHPIDNFVLDFYCHSALLVVELDGEYHFTEEQKRLDAKRTASLSNLGLTVIRFTNHEVFHHLETVLMKIKQASAPDPRGEKVASYPRGEKVASYPREELGRFSPLGSGAESLPPSKSGKVP